MWILPGLPVIIGSGLCVHLLNADAAYRSISHARIFSVLPSVASNGRASGRGGGGWRAGHPHSWWRGVVVAAVVGADTRGNVSEIIPSSLIACLLSQNLSVVSVTWAITAVWTLWPVVWSTPASRRNTAPMMLMSSPLTAHIFPLTGAKSFFFSPMR